MPHLLSVVMPTYNGEKFIGAALESVRGVGDEGIELVIVDDGSSDRTLEIIHDFTKLLPIRLITPGRIGNWVAATNLGLREATGDWACFLHQDDLWLPNRIARLREAMEHAEGALVLHNAQFIGPGGQTLGPWTCPLPQGVVPSSLFIERLLIQNFIAIPSPVFRRTVAVDSGGLDEALWFTADWDLWLRLGAIGPVSFVAETLCSFRVHPASQTVARKLQPNEWEQQLTTVLARHLPSWAMHGERTRLVEQVAMASVAVNSMLAGVSRGESVRTWDVLFQLLALGPSGWLRYLRDSRIMQRVRSRLATQQ